MNTSTPCLARNSLFQLSLFQDQAAFNEDNRKIEILLVEDDPDEAGLAIRNLRKCSFVDRLVHLQGGEEVLNYLHAEESYVEGYIKDSLKIILLDLRMPKINGHEVLRKLKTDVLTMYIPVVMLSFSDYDPDISQGYKLGAYSHIVKPLSPFNFSKIISELRVIRTMDWKHLN